MEPGYNCDKVIRYNPQRQFVLIEYPGIVKNVEKMIHTLGGMKKLQETHKRSNKRVELRYRPDDPCCHPVCGDKISVSGLLLQVRKYRRKRKDKMSTEDEFRYIPEVIGTIETAYQFNVLCDFQYLPLYNDTDKNKLVNMIPDLKITDLSGDVFSREVPLFLPPPTFSRFDQPQNLLFREPKHRACRYQPSDQISIARPKRSHYAVYLKFEESWTPQAALPMAKEMVKTNKKRDYLTEGVNKLFEQRPIWSKNALVCQLQTTHEQIKNVLPTVAYYFISGPWRSLWVKFGYDPRKDPKSARLQLFDFRVRNKRNNPDLPIHVKRSTLNYQLPNLMARGKDGSQNAVSSLKSEDSKKKQKPKAHEDAVYVYKPGVLPAYRQMFYQLCDIKLPEVEVMLREYSNNPKPTSCNEKSGWFEETLKPRVRDLLKIDISKTISSQKNIRVINDDGKTHNKRARKNLSAEEKKIAERNEQVDSFHALGMQSESSSDEEDEYDVLEEEESDSPEEEELGEDDVDELSNAAADAFADLEEVPQGSSDEDIDDFLKGFNALISEADIGEDKSTS